MAVTGKGASPLVSVWLKRRKKSSITPFAKTDTDSAEVVIFNDWLFASAGGSTVYTITAQGGSYAVTGASASINKSKFLVAQGGAYSFVGNSATLLKSKVLVAQGGVYSYLGQDVVITFSAGATVYTLTAQGGSYSFTGSSTIILKSKLLTANGGTYSTTGQSASIYKSKLITASGGVYNYTGSSAVITYATVGGAVWPLESQVLLGITYGPTGSEYVGTLDVLGIKYDITTGNLVKPINSKVVMTL